MMPRSMGRPSWPRGFTLIELMVVVAIVVMAMGIMAPTLLEFFRNQKLKSVRSHFSSALTVARLMAVTEASPVRVVFFKEGVRVYSMRNRWFRKEEDFNPESAPGSISGITFNLRFAREGGMPNSELPEYRKWAEGQPYLDQTPAPNAPKAGTCDVKGLVAIEFQRDGSVIWTKGADVPSTLLNREPPDADLIVEQVGNSKALYIDIRNTGSIRAEFGTAPETFEMNAEK